LAGTDSCHRSVANLFAYRGFDLQTLSHPSEVVVCNLVVANIPDYILHINDGEEFVQTAAGAADDDSY
jgi:hypothetical protein